MSYIVDNSLEIIEDAKRNLKESALMLQSNTTEFLKEHNERIIKISEAVKLRPGLMLKGTKSKVAEGQDYLKRAFNNRINFEKNKINGLAKLIEISSPEKIIKRGFSITRDRNGKVVKDIKDISAGDAIITELANGSVESEVQKVKKGLK